MAEQRSPGIDPRFDPVFQHGYEPAAHTPAPAPVPDAIVVPEFAPTAVAASAGAVDDDIEPVGRNPWLVALLLCSLALIALGVGMLVAFGTGVVVNGSSSTSNPFQLAMQTVLYQAPPALMIAGFLGLAGWIGIGAVARRP